MQNKKILAPILAGEGAAAIDQKLAAGPQETIRLPHDPLNPKDALVPVEINGCGWLVPRGEAVTVPAPVAALLSGAGYL